ncbi:hypothetical protein C8J56DRAFT_910888 [Mycena floridula]|nr:hypothetical protein C8J56DRAFT_910888 [Mycena floridula]
MSQSLATRFQQIFVLHMQYYNMQNMVANILRALSRSSNTSAADALKRRIRDADKTDPTSFAMDLITCWNEWQLPSSIWTIFSQIFSLQIFFSESLITVFERIFSSHLQWINIDSIPDELLRALPPRSSTPSPQNELYNAVARIIVDWAEGDGKDPTSLALSLFDCFKARGLASDFLPSDTTSDRILFLLMVSHSTTSGKGSKEADEDDEADEAEASRKSKKARVDAATLGSDGEQSQIHKPPGFLGSDLEEALNWTPQKFALFENKVHEYADEYLRKDCCFNRQDPEAKVKFLKKVRAELAAHDLDLYSRDWPIVECFNLYRDDPSYSDSKPRSPLRKSPRKSS